MKLKYLFAIVVSWLCVKVANAEKVTIGDVSVAEEITIGSAGNSTYDAPYNNYYKYSTNQMIYKASEIGRSGKVTSIAFRVATSTSCPTTEVKVYLGHKSSTFSGTNDYVSSSNLTLVYSGTPTLGQSVGWEPIVFNQGSFDYNGTDNLVVVVTKKCLNYKENLKYYYSEASGCMLYRRNDTDSTYGNVTSMYAYYASSSRPVIKISIQGPVSSNNAPYNNFYNYSTNQMIYKASEIGRSGKITSIAFKVATSTSCPTTEVKVYLGHKSSTFSGTNDYVSSSNLTLVYSGSPTLGQSVGWEPIVFNQGVFDYNGTDNLVVVVTRKGSYKTGLKYYYSKISGCMLYRGKDDNTAYGDVTYTSNSYSSSSNRPAIKIVMEEASSSGNAVTIGDGTTSSQHTAPYNNYYRYSTNQMIYKASEIGRSGKITSIAFMVATSTSCPTTEVKVYLGHKSGTFFTTNDYVSSSNLTLVYSGAPTLGQSVGWEPLVFNQATFDYNGTDNLVVVVTKKSSYNDRDNLKYYYSVASGCMLYRRSDSYSAYGNVTNTSYSYAASSYRPAIRITMGDAPSTGEPITIGDGTTTTTNNAPYYNLDRYSTNQMIYKSSEVNRNGIITRIDFKVATKSSCPTTEVNVYLGHKSGTFSGTSDYVRSSNLTLVYSGSPTLGQSVGWEPIVFNQGNFDYNGTDNLVVVVTKKCVSWNSDLKYYCSQVSNCMLKRGGDDDTAYGNVTNTSYSYNASSYRPSIRIYMDGQPMTIKEDTDYTVNGVTYTLHTNATATVKTMTSSWQEVAIPNTVSFEGASFSVREVGASAFSAHPNYSVTLPSSITSIHADAFNNSQALSVVWNGNVSLTSSHIRKMKSLIPNVLIYVSGTSQLYSSGLQDSTNLVVSNTARKVILRDGYDFYCPKQFTANSISYMRHFGMTSGVNGSSAGWETIALPFNVETIRHSTKGNLIPFSSYTSTSTGKPFWLYSWSSSGWSKASSISYNTPYLICMPNNDYYHPDYNVAGDITFSSTYATVYKSSTSYSSSIYDSRQFLPSFVSLTKDNYIYNINSGSTSSETGYETPGSAFIKKLRNVRSFEGYIYTTSSNARMFAINLNDSNETAGIMETAVDGTYNGETSVYDLRGRLFVKVRTDDLEVSLKQLPEGVYIVNGQKRVVKR